MNRLASSCSLSLAFVMCIRNRRFIQFQCTILVMIMLTGVIQKQGLDCSAEESSNYNQIEGDAESRTIWKDIGCYACNNSGRCHQGKLGRYDTRGCDVCVTGIGNKYTRRICMKFKNETGLKCWKKIIGTKCIDMVQDEELFLKYDKCTNKTSNQSQVEPEQLEQGTKWCSCYTDFCNTDTYWKTNGVGANPSPLQDYFSIISFLVLIIFKRCL